MSRRTTTKTLFDALALKLPQSTTMADRVRMQNMALSTTAFGQGVSFWHAGAEALRSKSLDRHSYDAGDWFNVLDHTDATNGFGRGLPPIVDNGDKYAFMKPLLEDPALKPATADMATARASAAELLQIRTSTPLFHLGTAAPSDLTSTANLRAWWSSSTPPTKQRPGPGGDINRRQELHSELCAGRREGPRREDRLAR